MSDPWSPEDSRVVTKITLSKTGHKNVPASDKEIKMESRSVEERLSALEECYKDLAYEFTNDFISRLESYTKEVSQSLKMSEARITEGESRMAEQTASLRDRIYVEFYNSVEAAIQAAISKALSEIDHAKIAQALSQRILVTRPAQRHELKDAVAIRLATQAELKSR